MTLVFSPMHATVEQAVEWFETRGYVQPKLWRGPDGSIRGSAMASPDGGATRCIDGHLMTAENTYVEPKSRTRRCRACVRESRGHVAAKTCGFCGRSGHNRSTCK